MKDFRTCVKALAAMGRPLVGRILVSCIIGAVRIAASMAFVWVCKELVDIATGDSSADLRLHVGIMIGIMLVQILAATAQGWWEGMVVTRTQNAFRAKVFSHVLASEWHGREAFHSGDMVNRLEDDTRVVVDLLCTRVPDFIITIVQLLAASAFLFVLEPSLLWVLLILMPVAAIGSKMFFKTIRKLTSLIRAGDSRVQGHMQENLQQRVLVKTLGCEDKVTGRLDELQKDVMDNTIRRLNYNAGARGFLRFGFMAGYAAAFLWGVFGIKSGAVTFGMMTAFLQLVGQVQRPIADISRHIPAFIHSLTSVERLLELTELPLETNEGDILFKGAPGIRIEDVTFAYSDVPEGMPAQMVFEHFSHDFKPGTVTAIMGVTGAGKSTLTRLMLALLRPTSGSITVYDDEVSATVSPATRCNFRYVPQGNSLMSGTVRDNLLMANPSATEEEMKEALHMAVADFIFDLPDGLDTLCSEKGSGLSEGQAQRVAIARALLHSGGVLILDESTSALDRDTEDELLRRLSKRLSGGKTIIWITHRESVTSIADAVLRI
ncbi:MAG: ABC transporter ATP-binding protein [Bacteroidales bacterium]|nr:ABC transporter ATP-binding protein [Bacteroidales bacterium]